MRIKVYMTTTNFKKLQENGCGIGFLLKPYSLDVVEMEVKLGNLKPKNNAHSYTWLKDDMDDGEVLVVQNP